MLRLLRWIFLGTDEHLPALREQISDLQTRVKALERDFDDLHSHYRKLRAADAANTRHHPTASTRSEPVGDPEQPAAILEGKDALRARALGLLRGNRVISSGS